MLNEFLAPCCTHEPIWGIKRMRKSLKVTVRCDWCANRLVVHMPNPVGDAIDGNRIGVLWAILIGNLDEPDLAPERWESGRRARRQAKREMRERQAAISDDVKEVFGPDAASAPKQPASNRSRSGPAPEGRDAEKGDGGQQCKICYGRMGWKKSLEHRGFVRVCGECRARDDSAHWGFFDTDWARDEIRRLRKEAAQADEILESEGL